MLLTLTCLVLIVGAAIGGFVLLNRRFGHSLAIGIIGVSLAATLVVTVLRYQVAISNAGYEELTSDTFRYLAYGREKWLNGTPCCSSALTAGGTEGALVWSQMGFMILGDLKFAVFLAGSLIGLVGSWLFAISVKIINPRSSALYPFMFCLFPSVLYWSSSFGKEAFSQFAMGLAFFGLVTLWPRPRAGARPLGLVCLGMAVLIAWSVRPEIAVLIAAAAAVASIAVAGGGLPRVRRGLLLGMVVTLLVAFVLTTSGVLDDPLGLVHDLASRHDRTSLGQSQLGAGRPSGILGLAIGLPTAMFRPFPWEGGLAGLGSSLDTALIAIAVVTLWRHRSAWKPPGVDTARMIVFALVVTVVLFVPLAGYGNLGLLARMRSLTIPLLIAVIALAPSLRRSSAASCLPSRLHGPSKLRSDKDAVESMSSVEHGPLEGTSSPPKNGS